MKTFVFVVCLMWVTFIAVASDPAVEELESKIENITGELARLDVEMSARLYLSYIDLQRLRGKEVDLKKFPGYDARKLPDTVPHLSELHDAVEDLKQQRRQIMARDPLYAEIKLNDADAERSEDDELKKLARLQWNDLFDRLRENEPEYVEINDSYNRTKCELSYQAATYLINYYTGVLNIPVPVTGLVSNADRRMLESDQHYKQLKQRASTLNILRRELTGELERMRFGLPAQSARPVPETITIR